MNLVKLKCENCNAQLELDLDNIQAKCPYCGQKLLIDTDQLGQILLEREKTRRLTEINEQNNNTKRYKIEQNAKSDRVLLRVVILFFVVLLGVMFALGIYSDNQSKQSDARHAETRIELESIEAEMEEAIQNGDYELARIKANQLRCDEEGKSRFQEEWDNRREAYLTIIDEKEHEQIISSADTIVLPSSSDQFVGKEYKEVIEQLEELGFTNISTQAATEEAGLFNKENTVEHILIAGKTEFTNEDYFNKGDKIIVYYYKK